MIPTPYSNEGRIEELEATVEELADRIEALEDLGEDNE